MTERWIDRTYDRRSTFLYGPGFYVLRRHVLVVLGRPTLRLCDREITTINRSQVSHLSLVHTTVVLNVRHVRSAQILNISLPSGALRYRQVTV